MTTKILKPAKGRVLISIPFLNDQFFGRSVVLLTEHNEEGAVGLIINKELDTNINDVINEFPEFNAPLYLGGPVSNDSLFYLHVLGEIIPDSVEIISGLFWGGNFQAIKELIKHGHISSDEIRFFVGYSGWGQKQLDRELQENNWLVQRTNVRKIMDADPAKLWNSLIKQTNKEYSVWADFPVNPSLN